MTADRDYFAYKERRWRRADGRVAVETSYARRARLLEEWRYYDPRSDKKGTLMSYKELENKFRFYMRRLRNEGWDDVIKKALDAASEIKTAYDKPGPYTMLRAGMATMRVLQAEHLYIEDVLDRSEWKRIFHPCIKRQLFEILEPLVTSRTKVSRSGDSVLFLIEREGAKIGWVCDHSNQYDTDILAHADAFEASVAFVRKKLWESVDPTRVVLSSSSEVLGVNTRREIGQLRVVTDESANVATSKFATEYSEYLQKCLDQDIRRSVLFYGPPGSGKSTIARTLCDLLKLKSFRIRVEDLGSLGTEAVNEMVDVFKPDVVIFDDLDRATSQLALFETLESLHNRVKLVFATVNHPDQLDDALKRPGRFEEIISITKLDEEALRAVLGSEYEDSFDLVREWPVAFVKEYVIRRRLLGKDGAAKAIEELQKRVQDLTEGYENDEDQPMKPNGKAVATNPLDRLFE